MKNVLVKIVLFVVKKKGERAFIKEEGQLLTKQFIYK